MVVVQRSGQFGLVPVAESKVSLKLQKALFQSEEKAVASIDGIVRATSDFRAIAGAVGADEMLAVATSAVRNSNQSELIVDRIKSESGVDLRILTGEEEASYTFLGVISAVQSECGAIIDIGGGSMEIVEFENRLPTRVRTLPLGALKVSDRFKTAGPVSETVLSEISKYVTGELEAAGIERLTPGSVAIGTGGTVRNVGKMDRRKRGKRRVRLHGHEASRADIENTLEHIAALKVQRLRRVPGLNPDRSDSIVGGTAVLTATLKYLHADTLIVAGSGLREGIALEAFGVGNESQVRTSEDSIKDMCSRFSTWDTATAVQRAEVARKFAAEDEEELGSEIASALVLAALLVDAGSTIDFYRRYENAGMLIEQSNAGSLTHREIELVAAISRAADKIRIKPSKSGGQIVSDEMISTLRAGCLLRVADEVATRLGATPSSAIDLQRDQEGDGGWKITFSGSSDWRPESLSRDFHAVFGVPLQIG